MEEHQVTSNLTGMAMSAAEVAPETGWDRYGLPLLIGFCVLLMFALVQLAVFVLPESNIWKKIIGYETITPTPTQDKSLHLVVQKNKLENRLKIYRRTSIDCGGTGSGGTCDDLPSPTPPPTPATLTPVPLVERLDAPLGGMRAVEEISRVRSILNRRTSSIEEADVDYSDTIDTTVQGLYQPEIAGHQDQCERGVDNLGFHKTEFIKSEGKPSRPVARVHPVTQSADSDDESPDGHCIQVNAEVHSYVVNSPAKQGMRSNRTVDRSDPRYGKYHQLLFADDQGNPDPDLKTSCMDYQGKQTSTSKGYTSVSLEKLDISTDDRYISHFNSAFAPSLEFMNEV